MWAASMAVSQNIGVPWIMCQQYDAPDPVVRVLLLLNLITTSLFELLFSKTDKLPYGSNYHLR